MIARHYRGQAPLAAPSSDHRGIAYGDGLFETMRVHAGRVHWWDRHWSRLARGAIRLGIAPPDAAYVRTEAEDVVRGQGEGVLKLILSRGAGGRGYAPSAEGESEWQLSLHPLPDRPSPQGLALRWCDTRLASQPLLAGLKHCNRLEQVLARGEWRQPGARDADADEGLMCDGDGNVVSAVAANLFALREGRWQTPLVDRCGVAGICRGWALQALDAVETRLARTDLATADAVFLCNAVRGILPVVRLGDLAWAPSAAIVRAQQQLAAAHPAFLCTSP